MSNIWEKAVKIYKEQTGRLNIPDKYSREYIKLNLIYIRLHNEMIEDPDTYTDNYEINVSDLIHYIINTCYQGQLLYPCAIADIMNRFQGIYIDYSYNLDYKHISRICDACIDYDKYDKKIVISFFLYIMKRQLMKSIITTHFKYQCNHKDNAIIEYPKNFLRRTKWLCNLVDFNEFIWLSDKPQYNLLKHDKMYTNNSTIIGFISIYDKICQIQNYKRRHNLIEQRRFIRRNVLHKRI